MRLRGCRFFRERVRQYFRFWGHDDSALPSRRENAATDTHVRMDMAAHQKLDLQTQAVRCIQLWLWFATTARPGLGAGSDKAGPLGIWERPGREGGLRQGDWCCSAQSGVPAGSS